MWVMTSFGILMPAIRPAHTVPAGDQQTMQIRARRARDLDILRTVYMGTALGPTIRLPKTDYEYRAYCTPHAFGLALAQLAVEIDYTKFKPTTSRYRDHRLHETYNAIWSVVIGRLSTREHREAYFHSSSPRKPSPRPTKRSVATAKPEASLGLGSAMEDHAWGRWAGYDYAGEDLDTFESDTVVDSYVAEPDWDSDDLGASLRRMTIASLYDELTELVVARDADKPLDHKVCLHANSDNSRARCRRRTRRDRNDRIAHLHALLDAYGDEEDHAGADVEEVSDKYTNSPAWDSVLGRVIGLDGDGPLALTSN